MLLFSQSLHCLDTATLKQTLKSDIEHSDASLLPLQQGLSRAGYALYDNIKVMIISLQRGETHLQLKVGIFYQGVIAGCSCSDDPSPTDITTEYCELLFCIDAHNGAAGVTLIRD
jgi:hypothetical protein